VITSRVDCTTAERLAGAIAIGEATDEQRDTYRAHLAGCARCVHELGGERDIERVMSTIPRARDDERWDPDLRAAGPRRAPSRPWLWAGALAAAIAAIVSLRLLEPPKAAAPSAHAVSAQQVRALAALGTQTATPHEGRAESLAVGSANLSAALRVSVNAHGVPVRCQITQSSGDRALDESICRMAMHGRYP
jgi:anti-sigma factor RsiW